MFFDFFKKGNSDFSNLQTDLHSHLIPGIDDGAKTLEKSVAYIQAMSEMGFKKIITTPHIMGDFYPNTSEVILEGLEKVRGAVAKEKIEVELYAAAEYYVDDFFTDLLESETKLLTLPGNRLLIEFSTLVAPGAPFDIIFKLKTRGYQPVIAHPERYIYWSDQFDIFEKLKAHGCELQINLLSLLGHYGRGQKKLALKLLKTGMVDFAATDLHNGGHIQVLRKALKTNKLSSEFWNYNFKNKEI